MYESHFGFAEKPFNLTPDSRYLFLSPKHQEAYANLEFGVRERAGFLLLTGEVGTGKTTLIRHFLSQVGPDVRTAVVLYPALSAGEMFHAILQDLEVPFAGGTLKDAIDTLANALIEAKALGLRVVVLIDEAQNLRPQVLEQLRLLSNLETEREKLLTLVLVGQPELRQLLDQPSLRQLSQRITSRSHLEPLSLDETRRYIKHRLTVAGGSGNEIDDAAIRSIHSYAGGVPRVVNVLCDRVLVGAFGRGQKSAGADLVEAAALEVLPPSLARPRVSHSRFAEAAALFALGLLVMLPLRYCRSSETSVSSRTADAPSSVSPAPGSAAAVRMPEPARSPAGDASATPPGPPEKSATVRCRVPAASRAAAISAVEQVLGTPGFDTARVTLPIDKWRALRMPAVVGLKAAGKICDVALQPVDAATTRVTDDSGSYELGNDALSAAYQGTMTLCFLDRDQILARPAADRQEWARKILERRGLVPPNAPSTAISSALARVAAGVGAKPDPVEAPLVAALYAADGRGRAGGAR